MNLARINFIQLLKIWKGIYRLYDEELSAHKLNYLMLLTNLRYYEWKNVFLFDENLEVWASGLKYPRLYEWWNINEGIEFKFKYVWPYEKKEKTYFLLFLRKIMYDFGYDSDDKITIWNVNNSIYSKYAPDTITDFWNKDFKKIVTNKDLESFCNNL